MHRWIAALVALVLAVGLAPVAGAGDRGAGVQAMTGRGPKALERGRHGRGRCALRRGSDYVNFFGETFSGVPAIQAAFAEINSTVYKGTKIAIETVAALTFVKPDVAVSDSTWKLTGIPAGARTLPTEGQSTVVTVKQDDAWKIVAHRARVPQPTPGR